MKSTLLLGILVSSLSLASPAKGADPLDMFLAGDLSGALAQARTVADAGTRPAQRALVAEAGVHLLRGDTQGAGAAIAQLLQLDPFYDLPQADALPPQLVDAFYRVRDARLLESDQGGEPDIRVMAVGEIQNNSIASGRFNMDHFARGLSQILISDLSRASSLTLVDRRRLQVLRREIQLAGGDLADPEHRVPLGRLTGAQSYLFGSLMQVDERRVRLDLRWVNTATGEVMLAEGREAEIKDAGDLFALEREVLIDLLLPRLEVLLDSREPLGDDVLRHLKAKEKRLGSGSRYVDETVAVGKAVLAEEESRWENARDAWAAVLELNPDNVTALRRVKALGLWLDQRGSE